MHYYDNEVEPDYDHTQTPEWLPTFSHTSPISTEDCSRSRLWADAGNDKW
jgi:hypothetical protein